MTSIVRTPVHKQDIWLVVGFGVLAFAVVNAFYPQMDAPTSVRMRGEVAYMAVVTVVNALVAIILSLEILASPKERSIGWIAAGFAFVAGSAATGLGVLVSALAPEISDEMRSGVSSLLTLLWHAVLPICILVALLLPNREVPDLTEAGAPSPSPENLMPPLIALLAAGITGYLATYQSDALPIVLGGDEFTSAHNSMALAVAALSFAVVVLLAYQSRLREVFYLWLALAMMALTIENLLVIAVSQKYAVGWYVAGATSLFTSAAILVALLTEHYHMFREAEILAALREEESRRDNLTGLYNRRFLTQQLAEEVGRAGRYHHPLSILMLDIDRFKGINEEHGQQGGDYCLRSLANVLRERITRRGDFSARLRGDEFIVVMPEADAAGALELAEAIRRRVMEIPLKSEKPIKMTVSIGVATAQSPALLSVDILLSQAYTCLSEAKLSGRNRVVGTEVEVAGQWLPIESKPGLPIRP